MQMIPLLFFHKFSLSKFFLKIGKIVGLYITEPPFKTAEREIVLTQKENL